MPRKCEPAYLSELHELSDAIFIRAAELWPGPRCWIELAKASGLCNQTVYKLGHRVTKFPEARTVMKLSRAVGFQVNHKGSKIHRRRTKAEWQKRKAKSTK